MILKKLNYKYLIIALIISILWYYTYNYTVQKKDKDKENNTRTSIVEKWDLEVNIKVLGKSQLVNEQKLRFNQLWKIKSVLIEEWEKVKKDTLLAELDKTDVFNDIKQAEINLRNSRVKLTELLKWNTDAFIMKAKNNVNDTKKKLDISKKELENLNIELKNKIKELKNTLQEKTITLKNNESDKDTNNIDLDKNIELAQKDVEDRIKTINFAKTDLADTKIFEQENIKNSEISYLAKLNDIELDIRNIIIDSDTILIAMDEILWIRDWYEHVNDWFESFLSAKNTGLKTYAKDSFNKSDITRNQLKKDYNFMTNSWSLDKTSLIELLNSSILLYDQLLTATDYTYQVLENSIITTSLTETNLNSFKSSISSKRSTVQSTLSTIKTTLTTIKNLEELDITKLKSENNIKKKEEILRSAELNLEKTKKTLENLKNTLDTKKDNNSLTVIKAENDLENIGKSAQKTIQSYRLQIESKQNDILNLEELLKINQESLIDAKKWATNEQIILSKNEITQRQLSLEKAKKNTEKFELLAPFDGIIRKVDFKVWDNLLADEAKFIYIENPDLMEIIVVLDQVDIVNVKKWQDVRIKFDSYKNEIFEWVLWEINTTPIEQSWVISYEAKIILEKKGKVIYSWMTATIEIIISTKKDIILVSSLAIEKKGKKQFVKILNKDGTTKKQKIITGITNGIMTEVIKWVKEWDTILEKSFQWKTNDPNNPNNNPFRQMRKMWGGSRK